MVCVNFSVGPEVLPYMWEQGHFAHVLGWVITVFIILLMIFEIYKIIMVSNINRKFQEGYKKGIHLFSSYSL